MPGPLAGIRVVELGFWVAAPAAGGIMADWGADVIKIEPPTGDPFRGLFLQAAGMEVPINPPFELDNRGKRSISLDLDTPAGGRLARELVMRADVFLTNLRPKALESVGMTWESLRAINPRLIYCQVTGFGTRGPECNRAAYDVGAFWSRAGVVAALTPEGSEPAIQRGAMGDHTTGITATGAICAALLARQRTGEGQKVETSLLRVGGYFLGWDNNLKLRLGVETTPGTRRTSANPLISSYYDSEGRWFWLLGLQGDRMWPDLLRAIGHLDLATDARFASMAARRENAAALVEVLDSVFSKRALSEWGTIFDRENVWWAPVQTTTDLITDPQARAAGLFVNVPTGDGEAEMVATPADFCGTPWSPTTPAPELGQHTEEILVELGLDWDEISRLKESRVIP
ncbi:MAG: CaiB/BaiF CoA transferase family protein [Candidatus Binataceae bacterium]